MAKKISELTSASALDGSELIPVVQGGTTVSVAHQDLAVEGAYYPELNCNSVNLNTQDQPAHYRIIGDVVHVWGRFQINPSSSGANVTLQMPTAINMAGGLGYSTGGTCAIIDRSIGFFYLENVPHDYVKIVNHTNASYHTGSSMTGNSSGIFRFSYTYVKA